MTEALDTLSNLHLSGLAVIFLYGLIYGFRNVCLRVRTWFTGETLTQNVYDKVLDFFFVSGIIYYTVFVFKLFG